MFNRLLILFLLSFLSLVNVSWWSERAQMKNPPYWQENYSPWVDSLLNKLTLEQKIGQLFMVPAYSNELATNADDIVKLIENYGIGGVLFFQGTPTKQAQLTNLYQTKSAVPLLIAMDAEYGLGMRLDSTLTYPKQMALGCIQNNQLLFELGKDMGEQLKQMGVHVSLGPVVDINNNSANPVINSRSFGEDKYLVAHKATQIMRGIQANNVIATAKHFPGHGDTDTDSHQSLPVINHTKQRLENIEFFPFRRLINEGVGGVMIAHLYVPALDSTDQMATTLSAHVVKDVLQKELGFKGLIYTDALNMKGVSQSNRKGDIDMEAFMAGNDILLFPEDVAKGVKKIKKAIKDGLISASEIDRRVAKILMAKEWVGVHNQDSIKTKNLKQRLSKPAFQVAQHELVKRSFVLVRNDSNLLPYRDLTPKTASLAIGAKPTNTFQQALSLYDGVDHFQLKSDAGITDQDSIIKLLKPYERVIVSLHNLKDTPGMNWGITRTMIEMLAFLQLKKEVTLVIFGNPYALHNFDDLTKISAVLVAHQDEELNQRYAAQALYGGISVNGRLSITASPFFPYGLGFDTPEPTRFGYELPEEVGINSNHLAAIDSIAQLGIEKGAYPGCQILVAKNQKVIYQKQFGHHTYEEKQTVKATDLYDLASITKIASSLASLMYLDDHEKLSLDYNLCDYLPELVEGTPYHDMNLRDMLAHQAGLQPWIPFYKETLISGEPKFRVYSIVPSETFPYKVIDGLYIHKNYPDSMLKIILNTPLRKSKDYKYSDLGYYFFKEIIQKQTGHHIQDFVDSVFYGPLGMWSATYLPREKFDRSAIVPTEYDLAFRKQLVHGDVHDPGAAMTGGIGGHAGLFSNANDLAKLMQLYLNYGMYGGKRYLNTQTVKEYTDCQYCDDHDNRRGAGFDKPVRDGEGGPTCSCISYDSFGHSGFTGTLAWADPEEQIVYIFLSNRIYPSASNTKLIKMGIRTDIMQAIYDAIDKSAIELNKQTTMK